LPGKCGIFLDRRKSRTVECPCLRNSAASISVITSFIGITSDRRNNPRVGSDHESVSFLPVVGIVATRAGVDNVSRTEVPMTNYIGYDEDQKIHAVGTDPEDVMRETGVEYVLPATVALFQAFQTGDVV
jgi:hypothetical protein